MPLVFFSYNAISNVQSQARLPVLEIDYSDGVINLNIQDQPLKLVLDELEGKTGVKVVYLVDVTRLPRIDLKLSDVTLEQCIDYLLKNTNRLVVYSGLDSSKKNHLPSQIWILDQADGHSVVSNQISKNNNPDRDRDRSLTILSIPNDRTKRVHEARELLVKSLREDDSSLVRTRAAMGLSLLGDPRAVPALVDALSDQNVTVRNQSIQALGSIGGLSAISALGEVLLNSPREQDRVLAVLALSKHQADLARQYLSIAAYDQSDQVRKAALTKRQDAGSERVQYMRPSAGSLDLE